MSPRRFLRRAHVRGILMTYERTRFSGATCKAIVRRWIRDCWKAGGPALFARRSPEEDDGGVEDAYRVQWVSPDRRAAAWWWNHQVCGCPRPR